MGQILRHSATIQLSEIHGVKDQRFIRRRLVFNYPKLALAVAVSAISKQKKWVLSVSMTAVVKHTEKGTLELQGQKRWV